MDKKYKRILIEMLLLICFMIFGGILSVKFGMERIWDTRNYHIYNPYAFLNNRYTLDFMPADIQSYFNPLLDIPYYLMIKYFNNHPFIVTFLQGFSYGIFLFLIYKISLFIFKENKYKYFLAGTSVFIASGSTMLIRIIGWNSHDTFIADLVFIAIYLILKSFECKEFKSLKFLLPGLLLGVSTGLKLTAGIFALPIILTVIIFFKQFKNPFKSIILLISGTIFGFLLTNGFWMYKMYTLFGNPFMPYFNWFFKSPIINADNVFFVDFGYRVPKSLYEHFIYPFHYDTEFRFKILLIIFFVNLITIPFVNRNKFKEMFNINLKYFDFIFIFIFLTYIIWIKTFSVYRYFSPAVGFLGIILYIVSLKFYYIFKYILEFLNKKFKINIINHDSENNKTTYILLITLLLIYSLFPNYKLEKQTKLIRVPINDKILYFDTPQIPDNSIVLTESGTAILIPFLNPKARYIYFNSLRFIRYANPLLSTSKIEEIKELLKSNPDKIYFLTDITDVDKTNININDFLKKEEERKDITIKIKKIKEQIASKTATKDDIQTLKQLEYQDRFLRATDIHPVLGYMAIEFDNLGLDINKSKCTPVIHNILDDQYRTKYKPLKFYVCKTELKN